MLKYIAQRVFIAVPLLLCVVLSVFLIGEILPNPLHGDYGTSDFTEEEWAAIEREWGLDRPVYEQFGAYLINVAQGNLGIDKSGQNVAPQLKERFPATIELSLLALIFATFGGVLIGVVTATRPRSWLDMTGLTAALAGVSVPIFLLGYLVKESLQDGGWILGESGIELTNRVSTRYLFALRETESSAATGIYTWDTLVVFGNIDAFLDVFIHLLIPALVLATVPMALIARITRASLGEVLMQDYIRTARAKGLRGTSIVLRHGLRNALIPIVTTIGMQLAYLLSGAVLTETIFNWPGVGDYTVEAIRDRNWNQLRAVLLIVATLFVGINLLVDLSYAFLDPRVRRPGGVK